MKDGFIRVCAATPDIRVADCAYNEKNIMNLMDEAYEKQVSVLVFPGAMYHRIYMQATCFAGRAA